jgi:hypothetical protein
MFGQMMFSVWAFFMACFKRNRNHACQSPDSSRFRLRGNQCNQCGYGEMWQPTAVGSDVFSAW